MIKANILKNLPKYSLLFAFGLIILLICPSLIQDGMFMDGQQYACVSRNLADGYGTWWFPYLSDSWWKADSGYFMEHPPLVYWLQAGFFKVFGSGMYTERIYCLITALITAFLIHKTWKLVFADRPEIAKMSALPIICWIIVPVGFWGYQHNIQENTMGVFTLLSVYLFLKVAKPGRWTYIFLVLSGISIAFALLSKGPPGLFPIVVVGVYWITFKSISFSKTLLYSFIIVGAVCTVFAVVLTSDAAYESLQFYINDRLLFRVENEPTTGNRFSILIRLFMELMPAIGFMVVSAAIAYAMKQKPENFLLFKKEFLFFLLIGLAASLPLMLTPVQRGFYLNPALPFFGLAIAVVAAPFVQIISKKLLEKAKFPVVFRSFAMIIFLMSIVMTVVNAGKSRRDGEMLADIHAIGESLPERSVIGTNQELFDQWNLQFYFMRYYGISIQLDLGQDYLILPRSSLNGMIVGKHPRQLNTKLYVLWEPNDPEKGLQF